MAKQVKKRAVEKDLKLKKMIFLISFMILAAKLILILFIQKGAWGGSDSESYLKGADSLLKDGFFSRDGGLNYQPAGYPILIWMLSFISLPKVIYLVSFFQTIMYFAASFFFVERFRLTRLSRFAMPLAILLGLDPTLSLSSLVIGYESIVASCFLLTIALIIRYQQIQSKRNLIQSVFLVGTIQSLSAFLQPRGILIGIVIFIFWGAFNGGWKIIFSYVAIGTCVIIILPGLLVFRNVQANGVATISTNLGITMDIGAGDNATGGYSDGLISKYGVPCSPTPPHTTVSDNQMVKCVLSWYINHPGKFAILAVRKTIYFWSPWFGPLANGTMARNPWLKMDPVRWINSSKTGHRMVVGWIGKAISWIWLLSGLFFLFFGFRWLWRMGGLERQISILTGIPVLLTWITAIGTIGDHRFRLPTMGLSLFLQMIGYFGLRERFPWKSGRPTLEPRGRAR